MTRLLAPLFLLAALIGCDDAPSTTSSETAPSPADPIQTWEEQIAAVRSGAADRIRLATPVTSRQIADLANGCENLTALVLERAELVDADLDVLPTLPRLRWIKIPAAIGDDGAATIAQCRALEIVNLPDATFSDTGLGHLARLSEMELLRFGSPHVTDDGLEALVRVPGLKYLHLLDVPITDAGLKHVAAIETLESFYLDGNTGTTDDGLFALLTARPDIHFHKDQRHLPNDPNAHDHE